MTYLLIALLFSARPVDPIATEAFDRAMNDSGTVRALVARLEASDLIVHIQSSREMPAGIGGYTRFVTSRGGYRYVRITIGATLPRELRTAILAHELQHACEVADSLAGDVPSVRRFFDREGKRDGDYFETRAAIDVERRVLSELKVGLQAEPVIKFHH